MTINVYSFDFSAAQFCRHLGASTGGPQAVEALQFSRNAMEVVCCDALQKLGVFGLRLTNLS